MEPLDVEKLVSELEIAVDRLRSLYDQYFMGIEKLEPQVPRKDVERRIQVLRKEQIRNTAQRFRFQMILQRYNTYQTHWLRICREIENGTYRRHMMRAQQRFADPPQNNGRRRSMPPPQQPAGQAASDALAAELAELDREFAAPEEVDLDDVELIEDEAPTAVKPAVPAAPPPDRPSQPGPIWRKVQPSPERGGAPSQAPAAPKLASRPAPLVDAAPRPAARPGPPADSSARMPARPPAAAPSAPRLATAPPVAPAAAPSAPRLATAAPVAPAAAPRPASPQPAPRPTPGPAAPAAAPAVPRPAAPARNPDDMPEERVRQLYSQYVDAKRKQNESTAAITYEAVAKSLRDSSAKLRQKHGKPVDFEVAVKDGKAILKPVLK